MAPTQQHQGAEEPAWNESAGVSGGAEAGAARTDAAVDTPTGLWSKQFPAEDWTRIVSLATDSESYLYVAGEARAPSGGGLVRLRKLNEFGVEVWTADVPGAQLWAAEFTADGRAYLAGLNASEQTGGVWVFAAGGELVRELSFKDTGGIAALAVDAVGNIHVSESRLSARTYRYGQSEEALWSVGPEQEDREQQVSALATDLQSNLYIAGTGAGADAAQPAAYVRKVDSAGVTAWTRSFSADGSVEIISAAVDADGQLLVFGTVTGPLPNHTFLGDYDTFLRKYDADGGLVWSRQFGSDDYDQASDIVVAPGGSILISGWTDGELDEPGLGKSDGYVRAFDVHGDSLWARTVGTPRSDSVTALTVDGTGRVYAAGWTDGTFGDSPEGGVFITTVVGPQSN